MKVSSILAFMILGSTAQAAVYTCADTTPYTGGHTSTQKHIKSFELTPEIGQIILSNIQWNTDDGTMCGVKNPARTVSIARTNKGSVNPTLNKMIQYRAEKTNAILKSCFVTFTLYLPKADLTANSADLRITWTDTDGSFLAKEGNVVRCIKK